jgi:hypothetical protein
MLIDNIRSFCRFNAADGEVICADCRPDSPDALPVSRGLNFVLTPAGRRVKNLTVKISMKSRNNVI